MATTTSGFDYWAGKRLAIAFVEQLFRDGMAIEDVWGLNDDGGFAPYGEDGPGYTLGLREIDAIRERARHAA